MGLSLSTQAGNQFRQSPSSDQERRNTISQCATQTLVMPLPPPIPQLSSCSVAANPQCSRITSPGALMKSAKKNWRHVCNSSTLKDAAKWFHEFEASLGFKIKSCLQVVERERTTTESNGIRPHYEGVTYLNFSFLLLLSHHQWDKFTGRIFLAPPLTLWFLIHPSLNTQSLPNLVSTIGLRGGYSGYCVSDEIAGLMNWIRLTGKADCHYLTVGL